MQKISVKNILFHYRWRIIITFLWVVLEAIFILLIPFLIGKSIDWFLDKDYFYIYILFWNLALLTIVWTLRRLYDTRVYSNIYQDLAVKTTENEKEKWKTVSKISARVKLVKEFVDFIEHELTQAFSSIIWIIWIFIILFFQDFKIFLLCLFTLFMTGFVYFLTKGKIFTANKNYNDEFEHQVDYLKNDDRTIFKGHFSRLARFTVKLSDLESINYFFIQIFIIGLVIWSLMIVFFAWYTPWKIFSILNYVIDFVMNIFVLPMLLGQLIRLSEISKRLEE